MLEASTPTSTIGPGAVWLLRLTESTSNVDGSTAAARESGTRFALLPANPDIIAEKLTIGVSAQLQKALR